VRFSISDGTNSYELAYYSSRMNWRLKQCGFES
jgi:hypothetical protein